MTWSPLAMNPSFWALVRLVFPNSKGTQLVDALVILFFPIWFLWARLFTCIYSSGDKGGCEGAQKRKGDQAMVAAEVQ
jgi:hypothetical protein